PTPRKGAHHTLSPKDFKRHININGIRPTSVSLLRKAGLSAAVLALAISSAHANGTFIQPDPDFKGSASARSVNYAGGEATITGQAFTSGQLIVLRQNGQVICRKGPMLADQDVNFTLKVCFPADADV